MPALAIAKPLEKQAAAALPGLKVHVPELDGVRGLAVLFVVLYHLQGYAGLGNNRTPYGWIVSMGWSGVDLFFVLSGYLITGILLDSRSEEKYFQKFYARRMLRIFPLYYLVVAGLFLAGPPLLRHLSRGDLIAVWVKPGSQIFAWTFTLNVPFAFDYNQISRLIHPLWSLSIEEQFYLIWPVTVYLLTPRTLRVVCLTLVGSALPARIAFVIAGHCSAAFALTPCRTDALALGALLASTVRTPGGMETIRRWGWKTSVAALAGIILTVFFRGPEGADPVIVTVGISLVGICYASALGAVISAPQESLSRRGLRLPVIRFLGKYSYAIYVFHQAIIITMVHKLPPGRLAMTLHSSFGGCLTFAAIFGILTITAAMASWWLLERHFLAFKRAFSYQS